MANVIIDDTNLTNIADAIRDKGVEGTFKPSEMATAIENINTEVAWGEITGTLSSQTDLQTALDAKEASANKVTAFQATPDDTHYASEKLVKDSLDGKEETSNKVTAFQATPDDTHYPSEKLIKDSLDGKQDSLPSQTGQSGKFLTTDGSNLSWSNVGSGVNINRIYIDTEPTKKAYKAGEVFNPAGMVVKGDYDNGTVVIVTGITITGYTYPTSELEVTDTYVTISYTEGGITKTCTQNITVTKTQLNIPSTSSVLTYNESSQSPTWTDYDSAKMTIGGDTAGTNAGTYTATFTLTNPDWYCWTDDTTAVKSIDWSIGKAASSVTPSVGSVTLNALTTETTATYTKVGDGEVTVTSSDTSVATVSVSGTTLTISSVNETIGTATITISQAEGTNYLASTGTIAVTCTFATIYGASWDGSSSTSWTRTDAAVAYTDPVPYYSGMTATPSSPFDNKMPWSGMVRVTDATAGEIVAIPKFYYKLTQSGSGITVQIADGPVSGYSVAPAHQARYTGDTEKDTVYVGRYHCVSGYKSSTGSSPLTNITRSTARSGIAALGSGISQSDWAMRMTIWMLYIVEFADWNSQAKIGYGCGDDSATGTMGYTDSMPYHTGTTQSSRTTYGLGTQYRYIEGLWDNVFDWVDGCYYNSNGLNVIMDPSDFSDTSNGTCVGTLTSGYPSALTLSSVSGYDWCIRPTTSSGSTSTYTCDYWYFRGSYPCLYVGGLYFEDENYGLFCVLCNGSVDSYGYVGCRLQKL